MAESGLSQTADCASPRAARILASSHGAGGWAVFAAFYRDYSAACAELGVTPLDRDNLAARLAALVERLAATLH